MKMSLSGKKGLSILEILVFILLISVLMIGISYLTVYTLRNSRYIQNKTKATRYAQQLHEWLAGQKEKNWVDFVGSLSETTYCIDTIADSIATISSQQGACTGYDIQSLFKRELIISDINSDTTEIRYKILVKWRDGANVGQVSLSSSQAVVE
ncbi:MAG: type IV pilus modification PilV family protein [Candidatus Roizmanbacteria bacterium]